MCSMAELPDLAQLLTASGPAGRAAALTAGFLREWTGRFGLLDASTGIYTDRTTMHAPQRPSGTTSQGPKSLKKRLSGVLGEAAIA